MRFRTGQQRVGKTKPWEILKIFEALRSALAAYAAKSPLKMFSAKRPGYSENVEIPDHSRGANFSGTLGS
jgi:hypothetical protein